MVHREPPNLDHPIYPTNLVAALVAVLNDAGIPATEALRGSDIAPDKLHAPETRISYRQVLTVFSAALRLAPDPALAMRAGLRMHFAAYGVVGYTVRSDREPTASTQVLLAALREAGAGLGQRLDGAP